jgi:hypothetical protein
MSLDTVLQIGKALRNSENNLKYFKYVEACPRDKDGNYPICITIPVKEDFNFDWDNIRLTPENEREKLYYLKFKTSDADSSASKYLFGDIYYTRKTEIDKNGKLKLAKDFGNFTLEKGNAFKNGSINYCNIVNVNRKEFLSSLFEDIQDEKLKQLIIKFVCDKYKSQDKRELPKNLIRYQIRIDEAADKLREYIQNDSLTQFRALFERELGKIDLLLRYAPVFDQNPQQYIHKDLIEIKKNYIKTIYRTVSDPVKNKLFGKQDSNLPSNAILDTLDDVLEDKILQYADFNIYIFILNF